MAGPSWISCGSECSMPLEARAGPLHELWARTNLSGKAHITRYFTDGWGAYERHVEVEKHTVGKENTQKIESKHINLRTRIKRLVRGTICFSKTTTMHDLVIGLFINRYEFGVS